ncbi:hypothetical protein [Clostridium tertium]
MEDKIKDLITSNLKVKKENIHFVFTKDGRFWIDVLDENAREEDEPILEQYQLFPVSQMQDKLDLALERGSYESSTNNK